MILNAVMCVWNEEDIIESTVKHAFAQGCSNVFIVDNASTDRTVDIAINAGAKLAAIFETRYFSEDKKVAHLNTTVKYINDISSEEKIWWLYIDADEFPNFDRDFIILDILKQLDSSVRAVHGHLFDHIPTHEPYHVQGYHPADFQPICTKTSSGKVPLLRYDKGHPHLWSIGGAHDFVTHGDIVPTIKDILHIHHFPYRNPEFTFSRLKKLVDRNNDGVSNLNWHKEVSNSICKPILPAYESRYKKLRSIYDKGKNLALKRKTLIYDYRNVVRWYDIYTDKQFHSSNYDKFICTAIYYFFIQEYDIALCRYKDALDICNDEYIKLWLMVKIAECIAQTDINDECNIITSIKNYNDNELNTYINKHFYHTISMQSKNRHSIKDMIGKVEFYQSEFPMGIEEQYRELIARIEKNIFKISG